MTTGTAERIEDSGWVIDCYNATTGAISLLHSSEMAAGAMAYGETADGESSDGTSTDGESGNGESADGESAVGQGQVNVRQVSTESGLRLDQPHTKGLSLWVSGNTVRSDLSRIYKTTMIYVSPVCHYE